MSQTIIEKAKRYDEIIEEIKGLLENIHEDKREILEEDIISIFPEFQENEDERIRRALLSTVKYYHFKESPYMFGISKEQTIAWLEKQGNHANFRNKIQIGDKVTRNEYGELVNLSQLKRVAKPIEEYNITGIGSKNAQGKLGEMIKRKLEMNKQSDKTQGKSAIEAINEKKVEPKFNVGDTIVNIHYSWDGRHRIRKIADGKYIFDDGSCIKIKEQNNWELFTNKDERKFHTKDWIVFNKNKIVFQIKSYNNGYCTLEDIKGKTYSPCMPPTKEEYHLWTIQDAKPGDILASKDKNSILIFRHLSLDDDNTFLSYCSTTFSSYYKIQVYDESNWLSTNFVPATKAQRDFLFQKIKEAGYEWDANKKELRKIEKSPTNKVGPKFKVGDWIIHRGTENVYQVIAVIDNYYHLKYDNNYTNQKCSDVDRCARLWDITKDAKEGDVLVASDESLFIFARAKDNAAYYHFSLCKNGSQEISDGKYAWEVAESCHPATKEQRDKLEKAMADAGYTFDFEKKELKKIENKPNFCHHEVDLSNCSEEYRKAYYDGWNNCNQQHSQLKAEQTSIWSEEDEGTLQGIIDEISVNKSEAPDYDIETYDRFLTWLKSLKERIQPQSKQEWSVEDKSKIQRICKYLDDAKKYYADITEVRECIDWLKSLRPQNTWKPSDAQMEVLKGIIDDEHVVDAYKEILKGLQEQLKKLRGE